MVTADVWGVNFIDPRSCGGVLIMQQFQGQSALENLKVKTKATLPPAVMMI